MQISELTHFVPLGRSGLRVSPLCLGTMTFGEEWGTGVDYAESEKVFRAYTEQGGNFFDTADFYTEGTSERYLGQLMGAERHRYVVATKFGFNTSPGDPNAGGCHRKNAVRSVEESLVRLATDYIDLLWVHVWDDITPVDEMMRTLDDLVRAGKVRYIGVSDMPAWRVAQSNTIAELRGWTSFVGLQIRYNIIDRTAERDLLPMASALGLGVTPWSPLAAGMLSGKYSSEGVSTDSTSKRNIKADKFTAQASAIVDVVKEVAVAIDATPAQVALAWLLAQPAVSSPIIGARVAMQLKENIAALRLTLPVECEQKINDVSAIELGFPHDFLASEIVQERIFGGTTVIRR